MNLNYVALTNGAAKCELCGMKVYASIEEHGIARSGACDHFIRIHRDGPVLSAVFCNYED